MKKHDNRVWIVSPDGTGDYRSLQEAIDAAAPLGGGVFIHVRNGTYREKLWIETPDITLIGEDPEKTIIRFGDAAFDAMPDGTRRGTFRSYSAFLGADGFTARNLTFENDAGVGRDVGQAIAAYVDGDRMLFRNCRFLGYQDTLFCGSLPEREMQPGGFTGPREHAPRINGRQYFEQCFIAGDIDFIFGSGTAFFERCEIQSRDLGEKINGYITAASTPKEKSHGFVFRDCVLTGEPGIRSGSVYLGRPWRDDAKTVFARCRMGAHIHPEGWCDWNGRGEAGHVFYAECGADGEGLQAGASDAKHSTTRVSWAHVLPSVELPRYTPHAVLSGTDGWTPAAPNPRSIFLMGDSTVADYIPRHAPMAGWGQMLKTLLPEGIVCRNHAVNGRSTKSFIEEGLYDAVLERLMPGDFLLAQFGHNDEKKEDPNRHAAAFGAYSENLRRFIRDARQLNAHPVLLTPMCRRAFSEDGTLRDTHGEWPVAMRQVAREMKVPLIDMTAVSTAWIEKLGPEPSRGVYMHLPEGASSNWPEGTTDDTHFNESGALQVARMVWERLSQIVLA